MKVNPNAIALLNDFIQQDKFVGDPDGLFNGLADPELKPQFNALINQVAADFLDTVNNGPTEAKFCSDIAAGTARFDAEIGYMDTEDQEMVCNYIESIMDCVNLESSNGILNNWVYGVDFE
ncbi:DUF4844 domain-containing protein [Mucilaginibacter flavus]|uniref:DUF4844 domain-containing protein n=1 Tax=Mucilaginibacter flavus TaxID=931504 RepID=UPI0025B5CF4A|nr:DUF4844 domain-containing protein [Mucilaginibacter flavus]MDN3581546.1 DUF4844 domain-containing protein [Mucilaginibacter flavus]